MSAERIRQLARDERLARLAGFGWGLAEGLFFFIVPDVYISFATLFSPRVGLISWLFSIVGSVVAVGLIYLLIAGSAIDYPGFLAQLPGVSDAMIRRVQSAVASEGLPYTPFLVFGGVPLKVYAAAAFSLALPLGAVLSWTVFARLVRIAPSYAGAAALRLLFRRAIDAHPAAWTALCACFWVGFYILYFGRMRGN
jgi:hypothetical protein